MEHSVYDVIILWAGPAWLFCASKISSKLSVLILEKSESPAKKLLLSAKWRWNITNRNINPESDYVSDNLDFVKSSFSIFWSNDFLEFLKNEWIELQEEDNWRILLRSGKVKEFHERLLSNVINNWVDIKYDSQFISFNKHNNIFGVRTTEWTFVSRNFIIATWWPSFPKLWATNIAIDIANNLWLNTTPFYPALVWFETVQNFSSLSWSSVIWELKLLKWDNIIHEEKWPILFTHRWISGPCVFNSSLYIKDFLTRWNIKYKVKISISAKETTKRLLTFLWFRSNKLKDYKLSTEITNVRWLDEAKVCWWWIKTENLNRDFECKNIPWLYFIWECVDVTWKTWWYNLQWCWTSAAICADGINKKNA